MRAAMEPLAPAQSEMVPSRPSAPAVSDHDALMTAQEQTPAYRALADKGLICNDFRIRNAADLDVVQSNSNMTASILSQALTCKGCGVLGSYFVVGAGCVRKGHHRDGRYLFFGPGVHVHYNAYFTVVGNDVPLTTMAILNGTKAIVTVTQGFVGLAMDRGQPVLLPPGMHQWDSATLEFKELIDLASSIIRMGPYTLITVDEGYAAITQDNGEQKVLDGGQAHMLTHRNWKFEKFMSKKLQTSDVGPIRVTTGDNVPLMATATVNWYIKDTKLAALMAANTMAAANSQPDMEFNISKIREDVVRQVTGSLASFIGSVSYSGHGHAELEARKDQNSTERTGRGVLFDRVRLGQTVEHANEMCKTYGVCIMSINLISASPADKGLLDALSQGAVAAVSAQQTESTARGQAQATLLRARAEADALRIRAEGEAEADAARAQGSIKAAELLEQSEVAVELAKLQQTGACLAQGQANSFFFGLQGASEIPAGLLKSAGGAGEA